MTTSRSTRLGVAAFATVSLLIGLVYTILGTVAANALDPILGDIHKMAIMLHIIVYVLLIAFSCVGLYGTIRNSRKPITVYWASILAHLFFAIASGAFLLHLLFQDAPSVPPQSEELEGVEGGYQDDGSDRCSKLPQGDSFAQGLCHRTSSLKGVSVAFLVLTWLLEMFGLFIINTYSGQLTQDTISKTEKKVYGEDYDDERF